MLKPLQSSRPAGIAQKDFPLASMADARLWQDPLAAAYRHIMAEGDDQDWIQWTREKMAYLRENPERTLVLPVMLQSGRSAEDHENRLRGRYAVLSALGASRYYPTDPTKIRYIGFQWQAAKGLRMVGKEGIKASPDETIVIPFEICRHDGHGEADREAFHQVLVLWLPDEDLEAKPLEKLQALRESIAAELGGDVNPTFRLVGPTRSDILQTFLAAPDPALAFDVYCPWSTVHPALLYDAGTSGFTFEPDRDRWIRTDAPDLPAVFRTTPNDLDMLKLVVDELKLRGVKLAGGAGGPDSPDSSGGPGGRASPDRGDDAAEDADTVIVISEWDRLYGRNMPATFAAACRIRELEAARCRADDRCPVDDAHRYCRLSVTEEADVLESCLASGPPPSILHYSYLQGLDGIVPETRVAAAQGDSKEAQAARIRPLGPSQLDYIRRLASQLQRDKGAFGDDASRRIVAIGVLGSDVYDKLLVLQALRDVYPGVLFFTTDLDARLVQPSEQKWARNLVVATGYGLTLATEPGEPHLAPFRGTYMHALYRACRRAVTGDRDTPATAPRLFEIGRTQAVQLVPVLAQTGWNSGGRSWPILLAVFVLLLALLLFLLARMRCDFTNENRSRILYSIGLPLLLLAVVGGIWWIFGRSPVDPGEPFYFLEGVSVWPTELVRMLAAFLCVLFLVQMVFDLRGNRRYLAGRFALGDGEHESGRWWKPVRHVICIMVRTWPAAENGLQPERIWGEYLRLGRARNRVGRVMILIVVYGLLAWYLIATLGQPQVPYRGAASAFADRLVLAVSVLAMLVLVFFVVDATLLCRRFIQMLSDGRSRWPAASLAVAARERNLDQDLAAEWLDIALVARRTRTVGRFVVYPFVILLLMIISRNSFFDRWSWPLSLVLIFGINSSFAIMSAVVMRRAAEQARQRALRRLRGYLLVHQGRGESARASQAASLIQEIGALREGSFAPLSQNPLFGAILMPFGGISLAVVLEMLSGAG